MKIFRSGSVVQFSEFQEMNTRVVFAATEDGLVTMDSSRGSFTFTKEEYRQIIADSARLIDP